MSPRAHNYRLLILGDAGVNAGNCLDPSHLADDSFGQKEARRIRWQSSEKPDLGGMGSPSCNEGSAADAGGEG